MPVATTAELSDNAPDTVKVPAEIVVVPAYVLLPDNIHVPVLSFVSAPVVPNPIILATVFPEVVVPLKVKVKPVPLIVPELLNVIPP